VQKARLRLPPSAPGPWKRILDSVILVLHFSKHFGPPTAIKDFLVSHAGKLLLVRHPLSFTGDSRSYFDYFENGRLIWSKKTRPIPLPSTVLESNMTSYEFIVALKEFIVSLIFVFRIAPKTGRWRLSIAVDPVTGLISLLFRTLKISKISVQLVGDTMVRRLNNRVLNFLYQQCVRVCVLKANFVWFPGEVVKSSVIQRFGSPKRPYLLLQGAYIPPDASHLGCRGRLVFHRHLVKTSGADLLIRAMSLLVPRFPQMVLHIFGEGPESSALERQIKELNLQNNVCLMGYVPHNELVSLLPSYDVGVANYMVDMEERGWSRAEFIDLTVSMMEDLAAGLPLIVTKGIGGGVISKLGLGMEVEYDEKSIADALTELLENEAKLKEMKRNARKFGESRDWNIIIQHAFERIARTISPCSIN